MFRHAIVPQGIITDIPAATSRREHPTAVTEPKSVGSVDAGGPKPTASTRGRPRRTRNLSGTGRSIISSSSGSGTSSGRSRTSPRAAAGGKVSATVTSRKEQRSLPLGFGEEGPFDGTVDPPLGGFVPLFPFCAKSDAVVRKLATQKLKPLDEAKAVKHLVGALKTWSDTAL